MKTGILNGIQSAIIGSLMIAGLSTPANAQKVYYAIDIRDRTGSSTTRTEMIYRSDLDGSNRELFYSFPTDSEGDFGSLTIDSANRLLFSSGSKDSMSSTSNPENILRFDIPGGGGPTIIYEPPFLTGIDNIHYDSGTDKIYFLERNGNPDRLIRSINPDGTGIQTILDVTSISSGFRELSVGDLTGTGPQIFWSQVLVTGATTAPNQIYRCGLTPPTSATLVRQGFGFDNQINGSALDVLNQEIFVFYQDPGSPPPTPTTPSIHKFNMDGSGVLTTVGVRQDTGTNLRDLRVDSAGGKIYWVDIAGRGSVRRSNLDGSSVETLFVGQEEMPVGAGIRVDVERALALDLPVMSATAPEISVSGNSISISDGDTTPNSVDFTEFLDTYVSPNTTSVAYLITNTGDADLNITTPVSITGPHAGDFSVIIQPDNVVPASGGTTSLHVRFDPSASGLRSAEISITNDDADENPFNFAIQGTGIDPEIAVSGNSINISDGDTTPQFSDFTNFGSANFVGVSINRNFVITNTGTTDLSIATPISITGPHSSDFTVTSQPDMSVPPNGGTTSFTVRFDPTATGLRSAEISFGNNDADEDPFNFAIEGTGTVSEIEVTDNDGTVIPDGDITPSNAESTDFGVVSIGSPSVSQFTINNSGDGNLLLTGSPRVEISGSPDFTISAQPSAPFVTPMNSLDFSVQFIPASTSLTSATVSISNNDIDEDPYTFVVQGTGNIPDSTPPIVGAPGDGGDFSQFNNLGFTWAEPTDPETGIDEVELWVGTAPGTDDIFNADVTGTTNTVVLGVPDGFVYAALLVTNGAGIQVLGPSSNGIFVDTQAVQVTLDGTPIVTNNPTPMLTGTFLDPDPSSGVTDIQFRAVDNGYPNALFSATFDDNETSGPWSGTLQVPLPVEGVYRAQLRGIDNAFNRDLIFENDAIIFDQTGPEITYFGTPAGDRFDFFVNSPFTLRVETSDNLSDVTGFDPNSSDLISNNNLPATYTLTNAGPNDFEFLVEPGVDEQQYAYMISGPGAVFDGAGNPNLRGSSPVTFTYDITPPELVCEASFAVVGGDVQSGEATFISASFTEPVIGVDNSSFTVSGPASIVGISPNPGPDTTYVLELENLSTGTVDVTLNVSSITDRAGNPLVAGTTVQYEIVPRATELPDPAPLYSANPSGNTSGDRFGESLDLKGAVAVIGSSNYNEVGAVTVLVSEDATTFTERGLIQAAGLNTADNFGDSVATSGNWILVGAPGDDEVDNATGAAYFFLADEMLTTFTEVQKATVADFPGVTPNRLSRMGSTVAIDGITAAIGQPLESGGGGVFIYTLDLCDGPTGSWVPTEFVTSNDLTSRDEFGVSIALSGDTLLVGARRDDDRGSDTGAVYQFKRVGGNWNQIQKIVPGDTERLDQVGYGVDLDLTSFAFGAPGDDDTASGAGAAYFYRRTIGDLFFFSDKVTSVDTESGDAMGRSIAIKGSDVRTLLVGADLSDAVARDAGAVYVFQTPAGSNEFSQVLELTHPDEPKRNDRFGQEVAIDGEVGLIGNPFNDFAGNNNGGLLFLNTP